MLGVPLSGVASFVVLFRFLLGGDVWFDRFDDFGVLFSLDVVVSPVFSLFSDVACDRVFFSFVTSPGDYLLMTYVP